METKMESLVQQVDSKNLSESEQLSEILHIIKNYDMSSCSAKVLCDISKNEGESFTKAFR